MASPPFLPALITSLSFIIVTELGDKVRFADWYLNQKSLQTFFIGALLAMKQGALVTFGGAITALVIMTVLSTAAGSILPVLLKPRYTHLASIALFVYFGVRFAFDAWKMENKSATEELNAIEQELQSSSATGKPKELSLKVNDLELHPRGISIHGYSPFHYWKLGSVYSLFGNQVSKAYLQVKIHA